MDFVSTYNQGLKFIFIVLDPKYFVNDVQFEKHIIMHTGMDECCQFCETYLLNTLP
jgi:hypothetical protein